MALATTPLPPPCDQHRGNLLLKRKLSEGNPGEVIATYAKLQESGFHGDNYTLPLLVKAAARLPSPVVGLSLHGQAIKTRFCHHAFVRTALISMYSKFGGVISARLLFDEMGRKDLVAWNSMLGVYAGHGKIDDAVRVFDAMPVRDQVSYNTMLSAFASAGMVDEAGHVFRNAESKDVISWNSMIFAYAEAGKFDEARALFDEAPERNVVTWNTILSALLQSQQHDDVLEFFNMMKTDGEVEPDHITVASVLSACAQLGSLEKGRGIHCLALKLKLLTHPHVVASLTDMYAKCGSIERALEVFYKAQDKDIYCWNSAISALALHGHGGAAMALFHRMRKEGLRPDDITFIGLLSACSHAGLISEGSHYFSTMEAEHGLKPKSEHYGCMVDLLGRAGHTRRARELVDSMPFEPSEMVLGALLGACVVHGDLEVGEFAASRLVAGRDSMSDGEYMMLANLYAKCGRWEEANKWRGMMNADESVRKTAGWSVIEIDGRVHKFLAGNIY